MGTAYIGGVKYKDRVCVVKIKNKFIADSTPEICIALREYSKKKGIKAIVLDLNEIENIDTTAFACLISMVKNYLNNLPNIGIISLKSKTKGLAEILKISNVIKIFNNEKEALDFFNKDRKNKGIK